MSDTTQIPTEPCGCCGGSGKVPISEELRETLQTIRDLVERREEVTAVSVHACLRRHHIRVTAINNRLEHLRSLGLIHKVGKRGRRFLWALGRGRMLSDG